MLAKASHESVLSSTKADITFFFDINMNENSIIYIFGIIDTKNEFLIKINRFNVLIIYENFLHTRIIA